MSYNTEPVAGNAFNDLLTELHSHVFLGVPGESDPFQLSELERECIAFALAVYYECDHCMEYHEKMLVRQLPKDDQWDWRHEIIRIVLFMRAQSHTISKVEYDEVWMPDWRRYADSVNNRHAGLACYIALSIGIARRDKQLMKLAGKSIGLIHTDYDTYRGVLRDIDRVTIFMKAATSKNRTDSILMDLLQSHPNRKE